MVDIHSHILHGLDHGPSAFEVSLKMVQMAREAGTTDIVATPRANTTYRYEPEVISERIGALQSAVGRGIKIHRGCDFHLSPQNVQLVSQDPSRFCINGLSYLLVEFPDAPVFEGIERVFSNLLTFGLTPIVTHPERNEQLATDIPRLRRWVEMGIPLQNTAQSLLFKFGPDLAQWCHRLLDKGLVHFVASDGHDPFFRPPRLDEARAFLVNRFGEEYAELLLEVHPRAVIEGRPIEVSPMPSGRKKRRSWFRFGSTGGV